MSSILGGRENGSGLGVVMWCKVKRVFFLVTGVFFGYCTGDFLGCCVLCYCLGLVGCFWSGWGGRSWIFSHIIYGMSRLPLYLLGNLGVCDHER